MTVTNFNELKSTFQYKIIPLLQEYFFGDYGKIGLVLGKGFITSVTDVPKFADFEYDDKDILLEKKVYRINNFIGEDQQMDEDILANAGGVTVSYFEWVQDRQGYFWRESVVNERLEDVLVASFQEVAEYTRRFKVTMRTAAYMLGIQRVVDTIKVRGIYA